jgi:hypothetical protein
LCLSTYLHASMQIGMGKKGTNRIVLGKEAFVSAGSGSKLLRALQGLSKYLEILLILSGIFFIRLKCYTFSGLTLFGKEKIYGL